ncbi:MAG: RNA polymerase sigma factor [Bacteroidota bacterium]|nr:RNA polymerase sigma factor [Bacteroidota bacterium]
MPHSTSEEDEILVGACLKGDAKAQKILFEKYYSKMFSVCLRYTKDSDEARDILQEGFIKVFGKLSQYTQLSSFESWMKRIMVNTAIDAYRKTKAKPYIDDVNEAYHLHDQTEDVVSVMSHQELLEALQKLPTGYRTVFNMYVVEGYNHKEIADALNISEGTSKSQLAKARAKLQKVLSGNK